MNAPLVGGYGVLWQKRQEIKEKKYSKEKGGLDDNHSFNLVQAKRQTQKGRSVEATRLQRGGILD